MAAKKQDEPKDWSREGIKRRLIAHFYTRFHMSLILASCGLAAMVTSWVLLKAGVTAMLVRYPVATAASYLTFLAGVWIWLRYVGLGNDGAGGTSRSLVGNADLPDIRIGGGSGGSGSSGGGGFSGKGGGFDGGGASSSWAQGARAPVMGTNMPSQSLAAASASDSGAGSGSAGSGAGSGGGKGSGLGSLGDIGGDDLGLIILAIALVAAILLSSGYIVWMAPDIFSEAAFGAVLAGGLARTSREHHEGGWVAGVVKKTWWPFTIVLVMAIAFAWYCAANHPAAHTFREALSQAASS